MTQLPFIVRLRVLKLLPATEVVRCRRASKAWAEAVRHDDLWIELALRDFHADHVAFARSHVHLVDPEVLSTASASFKRRQAEADSAALREKSATHDGNNNNNGDELSHEVDDVTTRNIFFGEGRRVYGLAALAHVLEAGGGGCRREDLAALCFGDDEIAERSGVVVLGQRVRRVVRLALVPEPPAGGHTLIVRVSALHILLLSRLPHFATAWKLRVARGLLTDTPKQALSQALVPEDGTALQRQVAAASAIRLEQLATVPSTLREAFLKPQIATSLLLCAVVWFQEPFRSLTPEIAQPLFRFVASSFQFDASRVVFPTTIFFVVCIILLELAVRHWKQKAIRERHRPQQQQQQQQQQQSSSVDVDDALLVGRCEVPPVRASAVAIIKCARHFAEAMTIGALLNSIVPMFLELPDTLPEYMSPEIVPRSVLFAFGFFLSFSYSSLRPIRMWTIDVGDRFEELLRRNGDSQQKVRVDGGISHSKESVQTLLSMYHWYREHVLLSAAPPKSSTNKKTDDDDAALAVAATPHRRRTAAAAVQRAFFLQVSFAFAAVIDLVLRRATMLHVFGTLIFVDVVCSMI